MSTSGQLTGLNQGELTNHILHSLFQELKDRKSSLAGSVALDGGLETQVRSIIAETLGTLRAESILPSVSVDYRGKDDLASHGARSAVLDIDPAEPLMAAEVLFTVALPRITIALSQAGIHPPETGLALALHHAIWRRFPPGAIAYVDALREKLKVTQRQSRERLSRDLHDRIAHGLAAGLQRVELACLTSPSPSLVVAVEILRATLNEIQTMAQDLRSPLDGREFVDALLRSIDSALDGAPMPATMVEIGDRRPISSFAAEEVLAILVEATRNARIHAKSASQIEIRLVWSEAGLEASVIDDGDGYRPEEARAGALGLLGIMERAADLGGEATLLNDPGRVGIRLWLPFRSTTLP